MFMQQNFGGAWPRLALACVFLVALGIQSSQAGPAEPKGRGSGVQSRFDPRCGASVDCKAWEQFRRARPFPVQTIAGRVTGDRLVLIFSEPTLPHPDLDRILRTTFGEDFVKIERRRWMIGADGWLQDAVLTVRWRSSKISSELLGDRHLRDRLSMVAQQMWGTSFGLDVEPVERDLAARLKRAAPNLDPRPAEIAQWMQDSRQRWTNLDSTFASRALSEISATDGAYVSENGRLVTLMISAAALQLASSDQSQFAKQWRSTFRRFAVSSDVILGASWSNTGSLAIVGRRRLVPLDVMPPLRFETFATLARVQARGLEQSYERTTPSAGRLETGPFSMSDWAPIHLSPSLIDTEFGALLNITDQMLKSWSSAGQIEYLYFDYPARPPAGKFAFGATSIAEIIYRDTGSSQVLFNWNTAGAASIVSFDHGEVLVPNRTGALPVTYGAELKPGQGVVVGEGKSMLAYENKAYDYFAGLRDPNLSRVMSYTVLYQAMDAFKAARVPGSLTIRTSSEPSPRQASINALVNIVAGAVDEMGATDAKQRAAKAWKSKVERGIKPTGQLNASTRARMDAVAPQWANRVLGDTPDRIQRIRAANPPLAEPRALAAVLVDRNQMIRLAEPYQARVRTFMADVDSFNRAVGQGTMTRFEGEALQARLKREDRELKRQRAEITALMGDIQKVGRSVAEYLYRTQDLDEARVRFVENAKGEPASWIRTPSIVISWGTNDVESVGGHNLDAQAMRIQVDPAVTSATLEQSATGPVLKVPPSQIDAARSNAPRLARRVEHEKIDDATVRTMLAETAPMEARPIATALQLDTGAPTLPLGGRYAGRVMLDAEAPMRNQMLADFDAHGRPRMLVARDSRGDFIIATRDGEVVNCCIRALDISTLRDTLAGMKGKGDVVLKDFPERQADALRRNLQGLDDQVLLEAVGGSGGGGASPPRGSVFAIAEPEPGPKGQILVKPTEPPRLVGVRAGRGKPLEVMIASEKKRHLKAIEGPLDDLKAKDAIARLDASKGATTAKVLERPWNLATDGKPTVFRLTWLEGAGPTSPSLQQQIIAGIDPRHPAVGVAVMKGAIEKASNVEHQSPARFMARVKDLVDAHRDRKSVWRLYSWVEESQVAYLLSQAELAPQANAACGLSNC